MIDPTIAKAFSEFEKTRGHLPDTEAEHAEVDATIKKLREEERENQKAGLLEQKRNEEENKIECFAIVQGKEIAEDLACYMQYGVHKKSFDEVQNAISSLQNSSDAKTIRSALESGLAETQLPSNVSVINIKDDIFCVIAAMLEPWKNGADGMAKSYFAYAMAEAAENCLPPREGGIIIFYREILKGKSNFLQRICAKGGELNQEIIFEE